MYNSFTYRFVFGDERSSQGTNGILPKRVMTRKSRHARAIYSFVSSGKYCRISALKPSELRMLSRSWSLMHKRYGRSPVFKVRSSHSNALGSSLASADVWYKNRCQANMVKMGWIEKHPVNWSIHLYRVDPIGPPMPESGEVISVDTTKDLQLCR